MLESRIVNRHPWSIGCGDPDPQKRGEDDNDANLGNAMVNRVANSEITTAGMVRSVLSDFFLNYDRMGFVQQKERRK